MDCAACDTERTPYPIMRRALALGGVLTALGVLAVFLWLSPGVREGISAAYDRLMLPYRMARLVASPPDTELLMPVEGVRPAQVADTWNAARSEGRVHEGQDIFARRGTPVYSATHGYVVRVGENTLGGTVVVVMGSGGRGYYYAHLNAHGPEAVVGQEVSTTSVIGYVGTSGNAEGTAPHLHFGIYTREGPIDPLPLLVSRE